MRRSPFLLAVAASTLLWVTEAAADASQDWALCNGTAVGGVSGEAQIAGCTARIQSGTEHGDSLFAAFYNRALARYLKGEYDLAISDYDQAIMVKPDSDAFVGRGLAYFHKDELNLANADFTRAIELKPKLSPMVGRLTRLPFNPDAGF